MKWRMRSSIASVIVVVMVVVMWRTEGEEVERWLGGDEVYER